MAGVPAGLPSGIRLSDQISLGVIARPAPPGRVRQILAEIRDGSFARRWIEEGSRGAPEFRRLRA